MARFLIPPDAIQGKRFTLSGSEAHHALHVLRKKVGDTLDLFDGKDASYTGRIDAIEDNQLRGMILEDQRQTPLRIQLVLYQALAKAAKWDWLVEKACEVGVSRIVPVETQRSVVKADGGDERLKRWNRIAVAASKQCGRPDVMAVDAPVALANAFTTLNSQTLSLIPSEKEHFRTIHQACSGYTGQAINLFIGPEGGWDPGEIDLAVASNVIPVRLGPTLLRTETAGVVSAALVLREFGIY